jgi:hypothetical protein
MTAPEVVTLQEGMVVVEDSDLLQEIEGVRFCHLRIGITQST